MIENSKLFTIMYAPKAIKDGINNFEFIFGNEEESKEDKFKKFVLKKAE